MNRIGRREIVIELLKKHGSMTTSAIRTTTGWDYKCISYTIHKMHSDGKVTQDIRNGVIYWTLPEAPKIPVKQKHVGSIVKPRTPSEFKPLNRNPFVLRDLAMLTRK